MTFRVPSHIPLSVNTPVVSLRVIDRNELLSSSLAADVVFDFKMLTTENRTSPFCVYWQHDSR